MLSNLERMIQLAETVFDSRHDPDQLDVNEEVLEKFRDIHPASVSEYDEGDGPIAWVLLLPTTVALMDSFLRKEISEKELFDQTLPGETYEAVYLCSALVLQEYRRKGITRRLALDALQEIRKDHPIQYLYVWTFTPEGEHSAASISRESGLELKYKL